MEAETYDLIIANGLVVSPTDISLSDVAVVGEQIAAVAPRGQLARPARRTLDATGCYVLPGGVDPHCHYNLGHNVSGAIRNEPQEYSYAAAYGGTTTIIDFAVQETGQSLHEAVDSKKAEAAGRMAVDYGLHVIVTGAVSFETIDEIADIVRAGIPTVKTFMTYGWMVDDGHRWGVMNAVREAGGMSMVHAEDDSIAAWMRQKYLHEGKTHGAYVAEVRGSLVEEAAIRRAILLAERSGCPLYLLHVAAGAGVQALSEARARRFPVFGETLVGYLSFTSERLWDDADYVVGTKRYPHRGLLWNSFPTLKGPQDQGVLWEAIADDRLQVVSSDHSAFTVPVRFEEMGSTLESDLMQGGQTSVELRVPVLYHLGVTQERISINRFVELIATNPAKIMGLYPRKGCVSPGSDADLMVFDPDACWTVRWEDLHMSPEYSCWDGWQLRGRPVSVVLRGSILVERGGFVGSKTGGRFIPRVLPPEIVSDADNYSSTHEAVRTEVQ